MGLLSIIKEAIYKADFFSSAQFLRFRGDADNKTLTGGLLSLSLIVALLILFSNMVITTLDKIIITSSTSTINMQDPPASILSTLNNGTDFMLGVQIWQFNLNSGPRFFDIRLRNRAFDKAIETNETIEYSLEPCRQDHWVSHPQILAMYDKMKMSRWLCLPLDKQFIIEGKYASNIQKTLEITVLKCKNETDPSRPCAPQSDIDNYFLSQSGQLFFTIFFINPLINPQSSNYLTSYLQDANYIIFGADYGSEAIFYVEDYSITTDESIMPYSSSHEQKGTIVNDFAVKNPYNIIKDMDQYCFFSFFKSGKTISYTRSYQKLIDVVSYIGGLFGAIIMVLFFVQFYGEYAYEMTFGGLLFTNHDNDKPNLKKYNFFNFLIQGIYSLLRIIKLNCKWSTYQHFHRSRQEMLKQLDIIYLFKKLNFLQTGLSMLLEEHQLIGLQLQQNYTIDDAKNVRKRYSYKRVVLKKLKEKLKQEEENRIKSIKSSPISATFKEKSNHFSDSQNFNSVSSELIVVDSNFLQKDSQNNPKETIVQLSSDSQSDSSCDQTLINEQEIINQLRKLKADSKKNNVSKKILMKVDPKLKKIIKRMKDRINKNSIDGKVANSNALDEERSVSLKFQEVKVNSFQNMHQDNLHFQPPKQDFSFEFIDK